MEHESRYEKFDVVDYLTCEECFREYIAAHVEDGATEEEIEDAYRDIERARIVHNIPERVASVAV